MKQRGVLWVLILGPFLMVTVAAAQEVREGRGVLERLIFLPQQNRFEITVREAQGRRTFTADNRLRRTPNAHQEALSLPGDNSLCRCYATEAFPHLPLIPIRYPTTDVRLPTTDNRISTTDDRPPTTGGQSSDIGHRFTVIGQRSVSVDSPSQLRYPRPKRGGGVYGPGEEKDGRMKGR